MSNCNAHAIYFETYVNALFPCPVFTDTEVTSAGAPLAEAPGVAQSGSP